MRRSESLVMLGDPSHIKAFTTHSRVFLSSVCVRACICDCLFVWIWCYCEAAIGREGASESWPHTLVLVWVALWTDEALPGLHWQLRNKQFPPLPQQAQKYTEISVSLVFIFPFCSFEAGHLQILWSQWSILHSFWELENGVKRKKAKEWETERERAGKLRIEWARKRERRGGKDYSGKVREFKTGRGEMSYYTLQPVLPFQ